MNRALLHTQSPLKMSVISLTITCSFVALAPEVPHLRRTYAHFRSTVLHAVCADLTHSIKGILNKEIIITMNIVNISVITLYLASMERVSDDSARWESFG